MRWLGPGIAVRMSLEKSNLRGWLTAYGPNLNLDMMFNLN